MPSAARPDVAIVGAGIAGLAAAIFLRERGLSVLCVDPRPHPHEKVGESLDWSSPGLLRRLGLPVDTLIADRVATWKRGIAVSQTAQPEWSVSPPPWIARRPLGFETVTVHVDRPALDGRLCDRARALGTEFLWEQVGHLETAGDRITACMTKSGRCIEARWYLDATGTSRLFARTFDIPVRHYGCRKVCLWTYFDTPPLREGTTFFWDNTAGYLSWVWDIPITPARTSVGLVLPADRLRAEREGGPADVDALLARELARYPRFRPLLDAQPITRVERTSFQPYVTARASGDNWLMIGEAASMPDPLTGNGVTSGIRHASHAVEAIASGGEGPLSSGRRRMYARHVERLGHSFNAHIERTIYQPAVRRGLGFTGAVYAYTIFAFFINALHARFSPRRPARMAAFACIFGAARVWVAGAAAVSRAALWCRGPASDCRG